MGYVEKLTRRIQRLQQVLLEAAQVLEETKNSFKSKRLGELRQKLMTVLNEEVQ